MNRDSPEKNIPKRIQSANTFLAKTAATPWENRPNRQNIRREIWASPFNSIRKMKQIVAFFIRIFPDWYAEHLTNFIEFKFNFFQSVSSHVVVAVCDLNRSKTKQNVFQCRFSIDFLHFSRENWCALAETDKKLK